MRSNVRISFYRTETGALFSYCKGVYAFHKDVSKAMQVDSAWVGLVPFTADTAICMVPLEELSPWERDQHFLFWGVIPVDVEPSSSTRRKVVDAMKELTEEELRERQISADYYMNALWARERSLPLPEMPAVVKAAQARRLGVPSEEELFKEAVMSAAAKLNEFKDALSILLGTIPDVVEALTASPASAVSEGAPPVATAPAPVVVAVEEPAEPKALPVIGAFPKTFITDRNKVKNGVLTGITELRGYLYDLIFYNDENGIELVYPPDTLYAVDGTVLLSGLDAVMEALQGIDGKAGIATISKSARENYNAYLRNLSNGLTYQLSVFKRVGFLNNPSLTPEYVVMAKQFRDLITAVSSDLVEWRKSPILGVPLDPTEAA